MTVAKKPGSCRQASGLAHPAWEPAAPFRGGDGHAEGEGSRSQLAAGHTPVGPEGDPGMYLAGTPGWLRLSV